MTNSISNIFYVSPDFLIYWKVNIYKSFPWPSALAAPSAVNKNLIIKIPLVIERQNWQEALCSLSKCRQCWQWPGDWGGPRLDWGVRAKILITSEQPQRMMWWPEQCSEDFMNLILGKHIVSCRNAPICCK